MHGIHENVSLNHVKIVINLIFNLFVVGIINVNI